MWCESNGSSDGTNLSGEQSSIRNDESANRTGSGHVTPSVVDLTDFEEEVSRKRKLTSKVWNHMVKVKKDGVDWAICNHCKTRLKAHSSSGTKSLHYHLNTCLVKNNMPIETALERQKQIAVERKNDGKKKFGNFTFDPDVSRKELSHAIILHEYPLSIVDHKGFRRFVASFQPMFKMVSRNTIKSDIFKIYDVEKEKLQKWLNQIRSRVAITTDMWTSNQKRGYMSIIAHFIDDNWVL